MVAATNVGDMTLAFDPGLGSAALDGESRPTERVYEPGISVRRGEELGVFNMGSTVIMLYEKGVVDAAPEPYRGRRVKMGESL
jgi:phosphatidylserine decarboxylase